MRAVEAIIFDYGGVFSTSLFGALDAFEASMGYPPGSVGLLLFGEGVDTTSGGDPCDGEEVGDGPTHDFHRLERGELSLDEYVAGLMIRAPAVLGREIDLDAYQRYITNLPLGIHWPVVHRTRELRDEGLRLAMLTNNVAEFSTTWRSTFPVDDLFPVVVDSSAVGMRKPESEIYLLTCREIDVDPQAAVFVDDNADNCMAAAALGIESVCFADPVSALAELDAVLARRGTRPRR